MTAALDIAVGSAPVVDLLDMLTLVSLGRGAMGQRWNAPKWGDAAFGVAEAFRTSMDDIWAVAAGLLSSEVEAELRQVIGEWQRENPDNDDVTAVRLSAYAKYRQGSSGNTTGLFALLRGATQTADTAVLLGDRALYATQRLPNLVRLHVQIAGSEIAAEAQRALRRTFATTILPYGAGLAVVGAASWLVARVAYRRHARRRGFFARPRR